MAEISVIVPIFNTEKLLPRCVGSILAQSFRDFELILVDDGSTDGSGSLCDAYAAQDSRVRVLHQKNSGVGAARNAGLDWAAANSDSGWITFVDSDDWIHPQMLSCLLETAKSCHVGISICGYLETENGTLAPEENQWTVERWKPSDFYRQQQTLATVPWGKLYAKACFETVRYPVGTYFDDEYVTYRLLFAREFLPVVPAPLYAYYWNPAGLTKKPWNPRRLEVWDAYEQQLSFFAGDPEMLRFRYREYLDNSYAQLLEVRSAPNAQELKKSDRYIRRRLRKLIRRAWKLGFIEFWMDYDMLYACSPMSTRLYRFWLDRKKAD